MVNKNDVLKIIDDVMNNREIDSIRNAILAIRDKVIEMDDDGQDPILGKFYAKLVLRGNNELCVAQPWFDGAKYVVIDTAEKIDTGLYGCIHYTDDLSQFS